LKKTLFDLISRYILPSAKRLLVEILYSNGLNKTEIAMKLHMSPSTISRYLKRERGATIPLESDTFIYESIKKLAWDIISGEKNHYEVEEELARIILRGMSRKIFCRYHKMMDEEIDIVNCRICTNLFSNL